MCIRDSNEEILKINQTLEIDSENQINFQPAIEAIIQQKPDLSKMTFLIWNDIRGQYTELSSTQNSLPIKISLCELRNCDSIFIKYQIAVVNDINNALAEKVPKKKKKMKQEKRIKERVIGEVMEKVAEWRKLHEEGEMLNLDKAAEIIGISRKTLDDYNLQMRRADKMGFDFNAHKNSKMGVLRSL
eukprot:TRINITY_DN8403_c0_g1_i2.p1 TRINITY_DN8403_c0_g1~~TRINITY_DN8403_c0_g1_i2.p1  ORF type:complete len:187 (-),score=46.16 TRINITY_DN8403_c0_g1_i2:165-725(-)